MTRVRIARRQTGWCTRCNEERLVAWVRRPAGGGRWRTAACCHWCGDPIAPEGGSKYGNVPTPGPTGKLRQSAKEASREQDLQLMVQGGAICDLRAQVRYPLDVYGTRAVEALLEEVERVAFSDTLVRLAREVRASKRHIATYVADFVYRDQRGNEVVEDPKGYVTAMYRLKKRLMLACHGIEVVEP